MLLKEKNPPVGCYKELSNCSLMISVINRNKRIPTKQKHNITARLQHDFCFGYIDLYTSTAFLSLHTTVLFGVRIPERLVQRHPCEVKESEVLFGNHLAEVIAAGRQTEQDC